ncbi:hypothetical protein HZ326_13219 [Fusarium oxysporum f. sp. albedinis]|nr:hypothetical protein HZ326_13219 [Fusarium oxysporum f. sp. albedinis]
MESSSPLQLSKSAVESPYWMDSKSDYNKVHIQCNGRTYSLNAESTLLSSPSPLSDRSELSAPTNGYPSDNPVEFHSFRTLLTGMFYRSGAN